MKFIEKLNVDYQNGKINVLMLRRPQSFNSYDPAYYTSDGKLYAAITSQGAAKIFNEFVKSHNIVIKEFDYIQDGKFCTKEPMWNDNYRSENPLNPTEKAPSFKSKW